jgi:hypothetical protein
LVTLPWVGLYVLAYFFILDRHSVASYQSLERDESEVPLNASMVCRLCVWCSAWRGAEDVNGASGESRWQRFVRCVGMIAPLSSQVRVSSALYLFRLLTYLWTIKTILLLVLRLRLFLLVFLVFNLFVLSSSTATPTPTPLTSLQLIAVYFFEYVISAGCASKVLTPEEDCTTLSHSTCQTTAHCEWSSTGDGTCQSTIFLRRNSYAIFAFCYQARHRDDVIASHV